MNPAPPSVWALHDHGYVSDHHPDPTRAVVTYAFDGPLSVKSVEIVQHVNGITQIEGFAGDSLDSMVSIGTVFGPAGDITGEALMTEGRRDLFSFEQSRPGRFFRVIFRKSSHPAGWAIYQAYPRGPAGDPIVPVPLPLQRLTYTLADGPVGAEVDSATGVFTWAPTEAQGPSTNMVRILVTDDGEPSLSEIHSFKVLVREANMAPVLEAIADQNADEHAEIQFAISATDDDMPANALTMSMENVPLGATFDPATGQFRWVPSEAQGPGTYAVTVRVTDLNPDASNEQSLSASQVVTILIDEVNAVPEIRAIADQVIGVGQVFTVQVSASDADLPAQVLDFAMESGPADAALDPVTGRLEWRPKVSDANSPVTMRITVSDNAPIPAIATVAFQVQVRALGDVRLTALGWEGGMFTLQIDGDVGPTYEVQVAEELGEWKTLTTLTPVVMPAIITDPESSEQPMLYYRVKVGPE